MLQHVLYDRSSYILPYFYHYPRDDSKATIYPIIPINNNTAQVSAAMPMREPGGGTVIVAAVRPSHADADISPAPGEL
jgi:hypothetical protein